VLITPDPATPEGEAVIDLVREMDELQARTGAWPGADTVDVLSKWLRRFTFARRQSLARSAVGRAWVLRQWDRHSDEVTLWSDEASALSSLAQHVRTSWDNVAGVDGVPLLPPADDRTAVDLYYGPDKQLGDEGYTLYADDISRSARAPRRLSLSDADACAEANSAAVFHAQAGPDDEGLPCIEIAGVLVFAYLDADLQTLRISVDLDTADEQLLRGDGTVPVLVNVADAEILKN
jgi:hypothetical protein